MNMHTGEVLDPAEAAREDARAAQAASILMEREDAYNNLLDFCRFQYPPFETEKHHRKIAEKLEAVERGEIRRLMIFMPPRHGKTFLATTHFPAWYLGRNPERKVALISYNEEKATDYGADVQDIFKGENFQKVFENLSISQNRKKKTAWNIDFHTGQCLALGPESSFTGRGANLMIIDDPYKDRQDANSENSRRKILAWYDAVAYTRMEDPEAIILICTRWHHADIAAELQRRAKDDPEQPQWDVLSLPALAEDYDELGREPGEALWPSKFNRKRLLEIKGNNAKEFISLYQQKPSPDEGDYFRREDFRFYDQKPSFKELRIYGTSDYATDDDTNLDYTVHCVWGVDHENNVFLLHMWRKRSRSDEWTDAVLRLMQRFKPEVWFEERGQIIKSVGPFLVAKMKANRIYCRRVQLPSSNDKVSRGRSYQGMVQMGMVHVPRNAEWVEEFIAEHTQFPYGAHDDMVDNGSLLGNAMETLRPGKLPDPKPMGIQPRNWTIDELISRSTRRNKGRRVSREAPVMFHHDTIPPLQAYLNKPEEDRDSDPMTIDEYEEYSS